MIFQCIIDYRLTEKYNAISTSQFFPYSVHNIGKECDYCIKTIGWLFASFKQNVKYYKTYL